jgi:hypothetical protein
MSPVACGASAPYIAADPNSWALSYRFSLSIEWAVWIFFFPYIQPINPSMTHFIANQVAEGFQIQLSMPTLLCQFGFSFCFFGAADVNMCSRSQINLKFNFIENSSTFHRGTLISVANKIVMHNDHWLLTENKERRKITIVLFFFQKTWNINI